MLRSARLALRSAVEAGLAVARQPGILRVQTAWGLGYGLDAGLTVILSVELYAVGGAPAVALLGFLRMAASTGAGLLAAGLLARWRPEHALLGLAIGRGLAAVAATAIFALGLPGELFLVPGAALGILAGLARPAQNMLLPSMARTSQELIGMNISSSTAEAVGTFAGPMVAAVCVAAGQPGPGLGLAILGAALSTLALAAVRPEDRTAPVPVRHSTARPGSGAVAGPGRVLETLRRRPMASLVIAGFALQTFVRGLLATLIVVLSVELLKLGEAGVGVLGAAIGLGGIGGMFAGLLVRRSSPAVFAIALAAWGLPIAVIGIVPATPVALVALGVVGLANALLDVVGFTLLQRGCRNDERAAVFGAFEASVGIGAALGSLAAPALLGALGGQGALVAAGLLLPLAAIVVAWIGSRGDAPEVVRDADIDALRRVPTFAALPLTVLERLVETRTPVPFRAGEVLMHKGEPGDRFLVIEAGRVEVSDEGRILAVLGPGSGVGEIALLRGGPRTATVTAVTAGQAGAIDGPTFLAAMAGQGTATAAAAIVEAHLARSRAGRTT